MVCKVYTRFQTKTAQYKGIPFPGRVLSARSKGLRLDESWLYTKSPLNPKSDQRQISPCNNIAL